MYAKIFEQIYDGSLCNGSQWQSLVLFQQMLILADQEGVVDMTLSAIARRTTIPLEILQNGLDSLIAPDPESRSTEEEGRRLVPLSESRSWGWKIVNYLKYRSLKREIDRKDYHREYWHKRKDKAQQAGADPQPEPTATQQDSTNQPIAYAEAIGISKEQEHARAQEKISNPSVTTDGVTPPLANVAIMAALRDAGVHGVNAWLPELMALAEAGCTPQEAAAVAKDCVAKGKPALGYVVATIRRRREDAAQPMPKSTKKPYSFADADYGEIDPEALTRFAEPSR